jgi:hypothetical protein
MGLAFKITAGPRQRSHSQVRVPQNSWPYFTVSDSKLPQPRGPGPRINISQEHGVPVIPPGTGLPFRRLLRLAGLRWRYSTPPPPTLEFLTGSVVNELIFCIHILLNEGEQIWRVFVQDIAIVTTEAVVTHRRRSWSHISLNLIIFVSQRNVPGVMHIKYS